MILLFGFGLILILIHASASKTWVFSFAWHEVGMAVGHRRYCVPSHCQRAVNHSARKPPLPPSPLLVLHR